MLAISRNAHLRSRDSGKFKDRIRLLQGLRTLFINDFELVRWVVYVFIGGAINASILQVFADYFFRIPQIFGRTLTQADWPLFVIAPGILVLAAPIILSIVLTRTKPEKQLIPPLYIQLVSLAWFAGFMVIRYSSEIYPALLFVGFYAYFVGVIQNAIGAYLLGISVNTKDLVSYSFSVDATRDRIESILATEKFRENLGLSGDTESEEGSNTSTIMGRSNEYKFIVQISQIGTTESTMNIVFYDEAAWYVRPASEILKEYANQKVSYLKEILHRPDYGLKTKDLPPTNAEGVVLSIVKEMQGLIPQFARISGLGWLKVVAFLVALVVTSAVALWLQDYQTAAGLSVAFLLALVFELRSGTFRGKD